MKTIACIAAMLFMLGSVSLAEQMSWAYPYTSGGDIEWANSVVNANGHVYAAGAIGSPGQHDILVLCLTAGGQKVWEYIYTKPVGAEDEAYAIVCGDDGNLYIAGTSYGWNPNTGPDFLVFSLTSSGQLRWEYRRSQATGWDTWEAARSLVYRDGYVYATGWLDYGNTDIWTVKLDCNDNGAVVWERRYPMLGNNGPDHADAIVFGQGNVYVAGPRWNGTNRDFTLATRPQVL